MSLSDVFAEDVEKIPDMELTQIKFKLSLEEHRNDEELKAKLLDAIKNNSMAPWYETICSELQWTLDKALLNEMKMKNDEDLKVLDEKISETEESLNDVEVRDAYLRKAEYLSKIGDQKNALEAMENAFKKTVSSTIKIEILFHCIRIGLFFMNYQVITKNLELVDQLIEAGGNWDLRNKFKVYKGLYMMTIRKFREAIDLFLETTSTFTSYEILDYNSFLKYSVLISMVSLPRSLFKEKIIKAPEIQNLLLTEQSLNSYVMSLYKCHYQDFFQNLAEVEQFLKNDLFLSPHYRYYVREMKIKAYSQLLQSYRCLSFKFMANAFGVTTDYIDEDLQRFITAGRLTCKIDKVDGIVETVRPELLGNNFQEIIKHGDLLLNRLEKLSRVINI